MKNICQNCGKAFSIKPSEVRRGRGKYCSFPCWRPLSIEDRFKKRIKIDKNGCWIWVGSTNNRGYGTFWNGKVADFAHHFSWEIANHQTIPNGSFILHSCDNPSCVNPSHLRLGSHKDNMEDMLSKGRQRVPKGEESGRCKYSEKIIRAIRFRAANGENTKILEKEFNISRQYLKDIIDRKYWKHID